MQAEAVFVRQSLNGFSSTSHSTVEQRHIFRDFFFFTGGPHTHSGSSGVIREYIHNTNCIAHNIPYGLYLIDQNLYFHIF